MLAAVRARFGLALVMLACAAGSASATQIAGDLYSNFTTFSDGGPSSTDPSERIATSFVPTASGTVSSLTIAVQAWGQAGSEGFSLELRADAGGSPGALLATGDGDASLSNGIQTVTMSGSATVTTGVTYWVVFYDRSANGLSWSSVDSTAIALQTSSDSGSSWGPSSDFEPTLRVTGTALTPPDITAQPTDQSVIVGDSLSLSVTATGATSYQWRKDDLAIAGATAATYTVTATSGDAGAYDVLVTGAGGTTTSDTVKVTVLDQVASTTPPSGQAVFAGQALTLSVVADNATSYLWRMNLQRDATATLPAAPQGGGGCQAGGANRGSGFLWVGLALLLTLRRRRN